MATKPKPAVIYVQQYGYFWKLTYQEWIDICLDMTKQIDEEDFRGYNLPDRRLLRRRPRIIEKKIENSIWVSYRAEWPHILVSPLDWTPDMFKEWLEEYEPNQLLKINPAD